MSGDGNITECIRAARGGDRVASDDVARLLARELRDIAAGLLRRERPGHTLQPTALVNEAWLRMGGGESRDYADRVHFFATAAQVMRRVLVDHARARAAGKRGGDWTRVTLDDVAAGTTGPADADVIALHEALERLHALSERQARVVELRWFGGLTLDETASELSVSTGTVENDWAFARAWLKRELG